MIFELSDFLCMIFSALIIMLGVGYILITIWRDDK